MTNLLSTSRSNHLTLANRGSAAAMENGLEIDTSHAVVRDALGIDGKHHELDRRRLKILLLRVRLLHPLNVGAKIRTAKMVEELSRLHDVTLVVYRFPDETDQDEADTARFCKRLVTLPYEETGKGSPRFYLELLRNLADPRPYMIAKYASREMAQTVARVYQEEQPNLVICDFPHACEGLRDIPNTPFVLFQHNVEAAIFEQLAKRAPSFPARAYLGLQARKMRRYEAAKCREATRVLAVSDVDIAAYARDYALPKERCDLIPTGVDVDYFQPQSVERQALSVERDDLTLNTQPSLVFTGSMDWLANQDGIQWFVSDIWPLIQQDVPDVSLTIVGRNPPLSIQELGMVPGITVTGTVPDIRPHVHAAQVYVVPLRVGSGTRLKLVEAMALGKAIVSTSRGAEGLPVENGRNMILADDPEAFRREVVGLLRDVPRRKQLEIGAREAAESRHSWAYVGRVFDEICRKEASSVKR